MVGRHPLRPTKLRMNAIPGAAEIKVEPSSVLVDVTDGPNRMPLRWPPRHGLALVGRFDAADELGDLAGAQVAVEFSVPAASLDNVIHCVEQGIHVVVGTTGWDETKLARLREVTTRHPEVGVLIAPSNWSGSASS